ncbi:MAG: AEC family transporter, partial [Pseudomonadota bacterium]
LPELARSWANLLAGAAVPCALFSVGASLRGYRVAGALRPALLMTVLKLVVHPLVVWLLATQVFDLPPLWVKVVVLMSALPVGVNAYLFAVRYEAGQQENAAAILVSNVVSVATLSAVLYWLGAGG